MAMTIQTAPNTPIGQLDLFMAKAQVTLAFMFTIGIFGLVFTLIFFHGQLDSTVTTIITSVIAALITVLTLQMNFFYARQRPPSADSPPSAPTLTGAFNATTDPTKSPPSAPGVARAS
jgi:hypothetical protein